VLRQGAIVHLDSRRQGVCVAAQCADAQAQIDIAGSGDGSQDVSFAQNRGQIACQPRGSHAACLDQHVRQARMRTHRCERAAMRRDSRGGIDGLELPQQIARLCKRRGRRRIQPAQAGCVRGAPAGEFQGQGCKIGVSDFRRGLRRQRCLRPLRP